ncbi:peptidylprolyl isomerase [Propionivibrio limicola]|uniref:peptidylprolyl isomerase n=1 Tax=Propionivibrio limicola TaxID=167645 RepID=UPI001290A6CF|nr:peptidylprolyl isomerase [Propionivibrio limicola]
MQRFLNVTALLLGGLIATTPAIAAGKAFVTVNGKSVAQTTADAFISEQKARGVPDTPELQASVREELIRRELLMQAAQKAGTDKRTEVTAQVEAAKQAVIIGIYLQDYLKKNPITDAQLKSTYDVIKANQSGTEYRARHILLKSEEDAKAIIAKLKKGAKFETLASQSIDPASKVNGGDLGWSRPERYAEPFANAMTHLGKGKYTETPVKTPFGLHVIKLEDSRPVAPPSFDELKPRLVQQAQGQLVSKMLDELRAKAKIE